MLGFFARWNLSWNLEVSKVLIIGMNGASFSRSSCNSRTGMDGNGFTNSQVQWKFDEDAL